VDPTEAGTEHGGERTDPGEEGLPSPRHDVPGSIPNSGGGGGRESRRLSARSISAVARMGRSGREDSESAG